MKIYGKPSALSQNQRLFFEHMFSRIESGYELFSVGRHAISINVRKCQDPLRARVT